MMLTCRWRLCCLSCLCCLILIFTSTCWIRTLTWHRAAGLSSQSSSGYVCCPHWITTVYIISAHQNCPCQSWPPNNTHPLDWLYDSLSSPPVAGVWWAHWRRCPVAAVASSKWMLHTGGGWGETPPHDCKALWVYNNTQKALYKCIIHSFIHSKWI